MDEKNDNFMINLDKGRFFVVLVVIMGLMSAFFFLGMAIGIRSGAVKSIAENQKEKKSDNTVVYSQEDENVSIMEPYRENSESEYILEIKKTGKAENASGEALHEVPAKKNISSYEMLKKDQGTEIKTPLEKKAEKESSRILTVRESAEINKKIEEKLGKKTAVKNVQSAKATDEKSSGQYKYAIQILTTKDLNKAKKLKEDLSKKNLPVYISKAKTAAELYQVKVGYYRDKNTTDQILLHLREKAGFHDAFVSDIIKNDPI
ncbi:MAG: hypothetical protein A2096_02520 [Spirochaetes bacterium GWF1_41_5]|nr:MAG: hypothetical protein A2096_02520 [Spirochaetes bacterium GWF1_41_5]HBE04540.1 hypothetical protein [Spirochaetia bacterium]